MKVSSSAIDLYGDYRFQQKKTVQETLKVWDSGTSREAVITEGHPEDSKVLSPEALAKLQQEAGTTNEVTETDSVVFELSAKERELINLLERFLSRLTGKRVKIHVPERIIRHDPGTSSLQLADGRRVNLRNQGEGWGLDYQYHETYMEKEAMTFHSQGVIQTEDGREIKFNIEMEMSREYFSSLNLSVKAGDALLDPLAINYGGAPRLTELKIDFDLDGDGEKERISFLEKGSGFLALDTNEDGAVNDGTELFGPSSGNGFAELAAYDADENGWIDENDPIFKKLKIWIKDGENNDQLLALGQVGIGAIYLGNVATAFALKDSGNNTLGKIQATGIFIKENGQAGTIQHIDLII